MNDTMANASSIGKDNVVSRDEGDMEVDKSGNVIGKNIICEEKLGMEEEAESDMEVREIVNQEEKKQVNRDYIDMKTRSEGLIINEESKKAEELMNQVK
ncbi:hypothetical protein SLA2020_400310 [Shorea laevis]